MGSHGGATAEGQREMLAELGVTEETIGIVDSDSVRVLRATDTMRLERLVDRP
jgi:hypothetical protein